MKKIVLIVAVLFLGLNTYCWGSKNQNVSVTSPNQKISVDIDWKEFLSYSITYAGERVMNSSKIGLDVKELGVLGERPKIKKIKKGSFEDEIQTSFYRTTKFNLKYNEVNLLFNNHWGVIFRVFDDGVAYRFYTSFKGDIVIQDEIAEFGFLQNPVVHLAYSTNDKDPYSMAFQNTYSSAVLSDLDNRIAFLPVTIELKDELKMTILESDLESYPGMFIEPTKETGLIGHFAPLPKTTDLNAWRKQEYVVDRYNYIAHSMGKRSYPWRILALTEKDTEMPVNHLVYGLASSNRIGNIDWIKPGKSAWEWWNDWGVYGVDFETGINMKTYKHYIDFASANNLEYVILDEGWYNPSIGNMMEVVPALNMKELVDYATSKGVGLILWTVFNVLDSQLQEACDYYSKLGIKGFKVDFLDRDDQKAVEQIYRIAEETAKHHLFLNLHGVYKPTGLNRTFPHIINFEGVFGMEEAKWSTKEKDMPTYDVTFPFIRMMSGPVDFTPGAMINASQKDFQPIYSNPMSQGTRCHQFAMYIVYDSPLTMLCDAPTRYEKEQKYTNLLSKLPVEYEDTKILQGKLGEYIVTARKKGSSWYVGGLTNWEKRSVDLNLSFLSDGEYTMTLIKDGVNAHKQGSDWVVEERTVSSKEMISIEMASGGGFAVLFKKTGDEIKVKPVSAHLSLNSYYKKYIDANGIPVVSSENVLDEALGKVGTVITEMLSKRDDVRKAMIKNKCRFMIIGEKEEVCDIPEYAHICNTPENIAFWNRRARGFGGAPEHDHSASCGEENVLNLPTDRYNGESILVHEFAHLIHLIGINNVDTKFDSRLENLFQKAKKKGLWTNTYTLSNKEEYFAESVQSFYNCNRFSLEPNGVHNAINNRYKLKLYDPEMYDLLLEFFYEIELSL